MLRVTVAVGAVACAAAFNVGSLLPGRKSSCVAATRNSPACVSIVAENAIGWRSQRGEDLVLLGRKPYDRTKVLSELIFLGTGSSSGTPMVGCLMKGEEGCEICKDCMRNPTSKNVRNNPSLLVRYRKGDLPTRAREEGGELEDQECTSTIIIDVGKTFKRSALQWFSKFKVKKVDALCITHEHADAIMGLDDMRELNMPPKNWRQILEKGEHHPFLDPLPVFVLPETLHVLRRVFPYLVKDPGAPSPKVLRLVSRLKFEQVAPYQSFNCAGLDITPLSLVHGGDCPTIGFMFGEHSRAVYLSDFNQIPQETLDRIAKQPVDLLVLDALLSDRDAATHIGLPSALEIARSVRPAQTLLVGMSHSFGDHETWNKKLKELEAEGLHVQLAHDGQRVLMQL